MLQANSMAEISDANATAIKNGFLMLRENDQEKLSNGKISALPI